MTLDQTNIDVVELETRLTAFLAQKAFESDYAIAGPEEIQYGWGWVPTTTFWLANRRVHFYFDFVFDLDGNLAGQSNDLTVEVSEIVPEPKHNWGYLAENSNVRRAIVTTFEDAWFILESFLSRKCGIENLPAFEWRTDNLHHDKHIPHPPDVDTHANIARLCKAINSHNS